MGRQIYMLAWYTSHHSFPDGRQELLTQIDSEEWESLDSVDMHTVPNAKAGPFSPRTGDSLAAASAAADVRNRAAVMSSESSRSRQSTPEKCAVSFWVPMTGGKSKTPDESCTDKPATGPPAHRSVPTRLLGYQRGAKSAPRAKQDYAVKGHMTHPCMHAHAPGTATSTSVWTFSRALLSPDPTPHAPCAMLYVSAHADRVLIGVWNPML